MAKKKYKIEKELKGEISSLTSISSLIQKFDFLTYNDTHYFFTFSSKN